MKIYTRITFDIDTQEILNEESFEYDGPVALCFGGGGESSGDKYSKKYNKGMLKIAKRQQRMAEEYFDFWRTDQKELDRAMIESNMELLPSQTALQQEQIQQERDMLGIRSDYERSMMDFAIEDLEARKPLARKYYEEAMKGEDPNARAAEARATVAQEHDAAKAGMRRDAARMGVNVNSARFQRNMKGAAMDRARGIAGAMSAERRSARDRNFTRMDSAMTKNLGVGV